MAHFMALVLPPSRIMEIIDGDGFTTKHTVYSYMGAVSEAKFDKMHDETRMAVGAGKNSGTRVYRFHYNDLECSKVDAIEQIPACFPIDEDHDYDYDSYEPF